MSTEGTTGHTYARLAYDDQDTTGRMREDCTACATEMHLPAQRGSSVLDLGVVQKRGTGEIEVSDAAVYLADRLQLHLD